MNFKKNLKKSIVASLALALTSPLATATAQAASLEVDGEVAVLTDAKTGQILFAQDADKSHAVASMTKMLVEYVVHEEIEAGNLAWDQKITPSDYAVQISQNYELSNVPLLANEQYTVKELYDAMTIYSANGATIALTEATDGTEANFVDRTRKLIESWGIDDAKIYNSTGLNNENLMGNHYPGSPDDVENEMSAKSMAAIAQQVLNKYPEVLEVSSIMEQKFREGTDDEIEMINWNWMLPGMPFGYEGVDGLKTGTTLKAGANFTGTAVRGDRRLLSVIMGAGNGQDNPGQRFTETARMFDYGFEQFAPIEAVKEGQSFKDFETVPVVDGKEREVEVVAAEGFEYLVALSEVSDQEFTYEVRWNEEVVDKDGGLKAPFKEGTEVGKVIIHPKNDSGLGFVGTESGQGEVSLVTKEAVDEAGPFLKFWNGIRNFFSDLFNRA